MPFSSQEFSEFATSYEFEVITSSRGCPQSNGKVENAIKTAKSIMKKAKQAGTDIYSSLLDWRNTPSEGMSSSPAQRMFGRRTAPHHQLPVKTKGPKRCEGETSQAEVQTSQVLQSKHQGAPAITDRRSRPSSP